MPETQACQLAGTGLLQLRFAQSPFALGAAQCVAYPLGEKRKVDRLGQKVGRAGFEGIIDGADIVAAGQHQQGNVLPLATGLAEPYGTQRIEAVEPGHADIHQDQIGSMPLERLQPLLAIGREYDLILLALQPRGNQQTNGRVIVDDQHGGTHASLAALVGCGTACRGVGRDIGGWARSAWIVSHSYALHSSERRMACAAGR